MPEVPPVTGEKQKTLEKESKEVYYPRASIRVSTQTEEIEVSATTRKDAIALFNHVQKKTRLKHIENRGALT